MDRDQMRLFKDAPIKIRYLKELPICGVCRKNKADYHGPTKSNIWANICKVCAESNTDGRFSMGYKLVKHVSNVTGGKPFNVKEVTDVMLVATGIKPRVVECEVCTARKEVESGFEGIIVCHGCRSRLQVGKLL